MSSGKYWNLSETMTLMELYPSGSWETLIRTLYKSKSAIFSRAQKMGLKRCIRERTYNESDPKERERRQRIGLANSIALKGKHCSPRTEFYPDHIPWNKGLPWILETKRKVSRSKLGQVPWNKGTKGLQQAWNKGKSWSEEYRRKSSTIHKTVYLERPELRKRLREARLQQQPQPMSWTEPEKKVARVLEKLGLHYTPQCRVGFFIIDFVLFEKRLAINVEGCFWHCCPQHHPHPVSANQVKRQRADARRERYLKWRGWRSVRIWEHDTSYRKVERAILDAISN